MVVCAAPLALGATHPSAFAPLQSAIFAIMALWLARLYWTGSAPPPPWRGEIGRVVLPLFAFLLWTGFEALALPVRVVRSIAPSTYQLYCAILPQSPGDAEYRGGPAPAAPAARSGLRLLPTVAESAAVSAAAGRTASRRQSGHRHLTPQWFSNQRVQRLSLSFAPCASRRAWLKFAACAALLLAWALLPLGSAQRAGEVEDDDAAIRFFFKALITIAAFEALAGMCGSMSHNRLVLALLGPLDWSAAGWGSRATGTFANPDHFAFFLNLALPACLTGLVAPGVFVRAPDRAACRVLCATAALLVAAALLLSGSRAGWVSAALGLVFLFHLMRRAYLARGGEAGWRSGIAAAAALALLVAASVAYVGSGGRKLVDARMQASAGELAWRITPSIDSVPMVERFPIFGVGLGAWPDLFRSYRHPPWSIEFYNAAHDDALQLLAETGIVGAGLFGLAMLMAVFSLHRAWQVARATELVYLCAALSPLPGVVVHELVDFPLQVPANAFLLSALLGIGMRIAWKRDREEPARGCTRIEAPAIVAAALLAMALALIAAAQSRRPLHPHEFAPSPSLDEVRRALRLHPADSRLHLLMAELAAREMDPEVEIHELRVALYLEPSNPQARDRYAGALLRRGQPAAALEEISKSVYYAPSFSAHAYLSQRRLIPWLPRAQRDAVVLGLNRASAAQFPDALPTLGTFYSLTSEFHAAGETFELAAAAEPDPARRRRWWIEAGRAFAAGGELARAEAAFDRAIRADGADPEACAALIAMVLGPAGRIAEAEADLKRAVESEPSSFRSMEQLGRFYLDGRNYRDAVEWLRRASELRPDCAEGWFWLGVAHDGAYEYAEAELSYARAVALAPDNAEFQTRYAAFRDKMSRNRRLSVELH